MNYLHWNEKAITDFSEKNIADMYDQGYVFTRISKGAMQQTRSARIDISKFALSSENRRILKKIEGVEYEVAPLPYHAYDFTIGKLGKDFYDTKFAVGTMSAQKIKEMLTDSGKSNFNVLFIYSISPVGEARTRLGYAISYESPLLFHYSYPFYDLERSSKDMGLGMMLRAIEFAHAKNIPYVYLGSLQRPTDTYKFQFKGLEWFDGTQWREDEEGAKEALK